MPSNQEVPQIPDVDLSDIYDPNAPQAPVPAPKPIKSKNRGAGNTIKYVAIAGLVAGALVAAYVLIF